MELFVFISLSVLAGLSTGFAFGCSHDGLAAGLFKGLFIGGLLALDLYLLTGARPLYCLCWVGASVVGSVIATYLPTHHPAKRFFDIRQPLDF